jgi:polyferredoxin
MIGGVFLATGMFIGRPYCRWFCPYGALLNWCSRLAKRGVSITPHRELDCGLCSEACPYGAIEKMRAVRKDCLYCARCYASCPNEGERARAKHELLTISGSAE